MHLTPIGTIRTPFRQATGTPIQPVRAAGTLGTVEIFAPFVAGLADLAGFERIWLIYWFDRAREARMRVIPYRDRVERGLFATRAPARPNPIGLSCVRLLRVEDALLHVAEVDILDGTPLLDIKPYVPHYDDYPVTRCGWVDEVPDVPVVADDRFERPTAQPAGDERTDGEPAER
ncbi:MAG: tRNA (N6-threonylcarbamoyladenosine(37)-N6)-methyltransferase TrmO [Candidatus Baltobacteraceae bacterium]|jgi:tRNA-Thr(GGU) m(6)t(6)A37 methyltransferase TsaA